MKISDFSIANPVKVAVGVILLAIFGVVALFGVPVQLTPKVNKPTITVQTYWLGASPAEIEKEIIEKQEEQLKGVKGMIKFSSVCRKGRGEITLEFSPGADVRERLIDVANALQQVREYPPDAEKPRIRTVNANSTRIAWFSLMPEPPRHDELKALLAEHPGNSELQEAVRPALELDELDLPMLYRLANEHKELQPLIKYRVDPTKLRNFAQDVLEAAFERVDGVAAATTFGGQEQRLEVIIDPGDLARRGITIPWLRDKLARQNEDESAGDIRDQKSHHDVMVLGRFESLEQVENVVIDERDQTKLKDIAQVRLGFAKPEGIVRQQGVPSIAISIQKEDDANVLVVMEGAQATMRELNEGVLRMMGLRLVQVYDQTTYIKSATGLVRNNILVGGTLAVVVLLVFLGVRGGGARSTLIVALAIPISGVGTFLVIRVLGRSINVISLAGMAFAVGMVVDNAIVVLENIFSHYQRGASPREAASRGTSEVWGAVLASTLTTMAVFIPVIFVKEQAGQLFRDIAIAISAGVALSLIVSLTVIPSAASRILRRRQTAEKSATPGNDRRISALPGEFVRGVVWITERLQQGRISRGVVLLCCLLFLVGALCLAPVGYQPPPAWLKAISWLDDSYEIPAPHPLGLVIALGATALFLPLAFWARRLGIVLTMVVLAMGLSTVMMPGAEYLPTGNRNLVFARLQPPPGHNLESMSEIGKLVEAKLSRYWEPIVDPETGKLPEPRIENFFLVARDNEMFMGARAKDPQRVDEVVKVIQQATAGFPGVNAQVTKRSLFSRGITGGRTIEIEISGDNLDKLLELGLYIKEEVARRYPPDPPETGASIRPIPSLVMSSPELHIRRNLAKAAELGVDMVDLGATVAALVDGTYVGYYHHEGERINLVITAPEDAADQIQDLASLPLAVGNSGGQTVPLSAVATIRAASGLDRLVRIDRQRAITLIVTPGESIILEDATRRINDEIIEPIRQSGRLEGGRYHIHLGGTADELSKMRDALSGSMLLAVAITYLLIAALYESFLYPLVIMISVPMAAVGGFAGLHVLNFFTIQKLDTLTMLGFIILLGTVVNNAILIVNQALVNIRQHGMDHREAVTQSVRGRIRPIFMSTLTTCLGMLPLVLFPGAGSELYRGLGSVVLGGLLVSTVFTLILVPMLFTLMYETRQHLLARYASPADGPPTDDSM